MAKILENLYPGKVSLGDDDHPDGSFKNVSVPGAQDGTPFEKAWANDWLGFSDALLRDGEVTADDTEDVAESSQRMQALHKVVGTERTYLTKADAVASHNYGVEKITVQELNDAPFLKITSGGSSESFQDASGQSWDIPDASYYTAQRARLGLGDVENLPTVDEVTATRANASTEAVQQFSGPARYYQTKAQAEGSQNYGIERIVIQELGDAPFERTTSGGSGTELFQDASGQYWQIPVSGYFDPERQRLRVNQFENLPLVDTVTSTRAYASTDAVIEYVNRLQPTVIFNGNASKVNVSGIDYAGIFIFDIDSLRRTTSVLVTATPLNQINFPTYGSSSYYPDDNTNEQVYVAYSAANSEFLASHGTIRTITVIRI